MSTSKVSSTPENKGVMTEEHFKMLFPTFTVSNQRVLAVYEQHDFAVQEGLLKIYKVPKESWLKPKLVAVFKDWSEIQVHAEK